MESKRKFYPVEAVSKGGEIMNIGLFLL